MQQTKRSLKRQTKDPNRKVQRLAVTLPDGVEEQILQLMPESCFTAKKDQHMGSPTCYEPRVVRTFLQHLVRGMPVADAAIMAGVSSSTVHGWANRHSDFATAIAPLSQLPTSVSVFALRSGCWSGGSRRTGHR